MSISKAMPLVAALSLLSAFPGYGLDNEGAAGGDAAHGRTLAQNWCASCHVVSPGQGESKKGAPSFATIAQSPDFNADQLAYFLYAPHPRMARLALSRKAINDIAAYILSLRD